MQCTNTLSAKNAEEIHIHNPYHQASKNTKITKQDYIDSSLSKR